MVNKVGKKNAGRFYIRNVDKDFIVPYRSFDLNEETSRLVDRLNIETGRNSRMEIGDELVLRDTARDDKKLFGGFISQKEETDTTWDIEVDEYVVETVGAKVKKVYRNMSPEAILEDLIENNTNLSFFAPVSSGFTLDKYTIEGKIEEAIEDMTDLLEWQARTTPQREIYFEPIGRLDSGESFTHGKNAIVESKKTKDSKFINTVELRAGRTNYNRSNTFTGDGSKTEFDLTEQPVGSVFVTVDGVDQEGAIAEDLAEGDDFYIDADQPSLVFDGAPGDGATIDIQYTYEVPILVEAETNDAKIPASEREVSGTIKRKWIKTFDDAREYAKNYVRNHANLVGQVKFEVPLNSDPETGRLVDIVDTNKEIDGTFVVEKKEVTQEGRVEITAGDQSFNAIEWRNSVQRRIQELEKRQTTNKVLTKYEIFDPSLSVSLSTGVKVKKREINDSYILGSNSNGVLGEDKLGDRRGSASTIVDTT